ncbi:MAG: glycosyltransferase, partial [Cyanobacteria bacterium J06623_7]
SYLPATIDSILQQTRTDFEILVFTDDCRQIRSWFKRQPDSRLRFILQGQLNLATVFNLGIKEARGEYIAFIQPGDLWHPQKLAKQISAFDRDPELGLVHSYSISIDLQGHLTGKPIEQGGFHPGLTREDLGFRGEILAQNRLNLSTVMVRRQCFMVAGLFDPDIAVIPDWEMWIRLGRYYSFRAVPEPLVYFRQYPTGSRYDCCQLEQDLQIAIEKVYARLPPERSTQKHLSYGYASLFLAEQTLYHKHPDAAVALNYLYQALEHDLWRSLTGEFCRLRWLVFVLSYRQSDRYGHLLLLMQTTGERLEFVVHKVRTYGQNIIDWMLEEEDSIGFWRNSWVKRQGKD